MKVINVVAAIIVKDNKIFATQRGYGDFKGGWEFPGGKIEETETPEEALKREILEELNVHINVDKYIYTVEYDYPKFHLSMRCYICSLLDENIELIEHSAAKWLTINELETVDWLPADIEIISMIKNTYKSHFDHIYYMNPIDWSFHVWAKNDNGHQLDDNRFYKFVRTVYHYRKEGLKWRTKDKFAFECLKHKFSQEKIDEKYELLMNLLNFMENNEGPFLKTKRYKENRKLKFCDRYLQMMYFEGHVEKIEITKEEFNKRKIGKKEFIKRVNK